MVRIVDGVPVPEYRVIALHYRFRTEVEEDNFDNAAAQSGVFGSFTYTLQGGQLSMVPKEEFLDRQAARDAIDPYLRDWEQVAYLDPRGHRISFVYESSEVEEVNPVPGFVFAFPDSAVGFGSAAAAAVVARNNPAYPPPDASFRRTPITDRLTERLRRVRSGETELTAAAYFVLSTLEQEHGGRGHAAAALVVDRDVLDQLGELSSRADPDIGRKGKGDPTPLTANETGWIRAAMTRLIRRVGEHASGAPLRSITLADLPLLP